jgi:K+-sensing histidine kinase KdpD
MRAGNRPHNGIFKLRETLYLVGAALSINLVVYELHATRSLFFLFWLAIAVTTLMAGWGYGLLAIFFSTVAILFFFLEPRFTLSLEAPGDREKLAIFVLAGAAAIAGAIFGRRGQDRHRLGLM